ncbi:MAG TPA: transcription termination factor Rho [Abditibacteriaceae bacterium]|jgi:transcription termination factor Rho
MMESSCEEAVQNEHASPSGGTAVAVAVSPDAASGDAAETAPAKPVRRTRAKKDPDAPVTPRRTRAKKSDTPVTDAPAATMPESPAVAEPVAAAPVAPRETEAPSTAPRNAMGIAPRQDQQPLDNAGSGQLRFEESRSSEPQHSESDATHNDGAPSRFDSASLAAEQPAVQSSSNDGATSEAVSNTASVSGDSAPANGIGPRGEFRSDNRTENRGFVPRENRHDNRGEARPNEPRNNEPRNNEPRTNEPRNNERDERGRPLRFRGRDGRADFQTREPREPREPRENRNDNRGNRNGFRDGRPDRNSDNGRDFDRTHGNRNGRIEHDFMSLEAKAPEELLQLATEMNLEIALDTPQNEAILQILEAQAQSAGNLLKRGILEILPDGKGFLRCDGYLPGNEDVYVSPSQIKKFNLKTGDMVTGQVRAPKEMERYYGLLRVEACNGQAPDINRTRKEFEKLTPIFPDDKFELETTQENITARIIDLVSPIGMGQRGLIVAPPKAGKTSLIKNVANSIMANHPGVYLIVLLIDERPEEVTDISRSIKGEVVASTFDELPENHIRVADMVLEKAKRMVEQKKDVVILLDSITRLSRASNLVVTPSGRTMSGGLDPAAMHKPKRLFGAARNIEEGGSLTILATVLVDTGSRMDEYIFEELKGTGNMDLVLDRNLFDQRIFPAIDINRSGTRRDDLLLSKEDLTAVFHLRKTLAQLDNDKAITLLIDRLKNTKTNQDFMQVVQKSARQSATTPPPQP